MDDTDKYLVASRQGIYIVNHSGYRLLREGYYFGITVQGTDIYCFQGVPLVAAAENPRRGSIVRYSYGDGELSGGDVLVDGLDYNGHQVDFFDGSFWLVDSA